MLRLDKFQKDFTDCQEDKILVSGRQTGKSEAQAYDNAVFVIKNPKTTALIISRTERQANELLIKTLNFLHELNPKMIAKGKDRPTQSKITLTNGSRVLSLPTGLAGEGIRYLTIHKLTCDEAQLIPDDVFTAVTPMLLTTGGKISLSGTPQGKRGFFWEAYKNTLNQFKVFHVNSIDVINNREISPTWQQWRKDVAIKHLERERERMSAKQFAQEYLGEFVEDLNQYFPDELINKCCILKRPHETNHITPKENNYLGVDIARLGDDECSFEIIHINNDNNIHQVENIIKRKRLTTETEKDIIQLSLAWNVERIGIDAGSGSLGVGIFDRLMENIDTKRKVVAMNNRTISMTRDKKKQQRIFKEDMYDNMLSMMEKGELLLLDDDEIQASLKSVQIEANEGDNTVTKVRIFGSYTHIAEGLVRACWLGKKEKINKVWIASM
jgi:hypothetical protein